jgi:N-acetylglucosamine-6-phosphate deacetylase
VVIVTDSVQAKKVGVGHYVFGGQNIEVKENGGAYLESGNLAGSTLLFNRALENVVVKAQVNEVAAINASTINPAKVLKLDHIKGRLRVGYDADIVVLNDDYDVQATYVEGKCAYTVK